MLISATPVLSQPEVTGWGNLKGIRIDGQLMEVNSSLVVAGCDWSDMSRTEKERQRPRYTREGDQQIIKTRLANIFSITETVKGAGNGKATVNVEFTSLKDTSILGAYFSVMLPGEHYSECTVGIIDPADMDLKDSPPSTLKEMIRINGAGTSFNSQNRNFEITTAPATPRTFASNMATPPILDTSGFPPKSDTAMSPGSAK